MARVLVIDDDPNVSATLQRIVDRMGHAAHGAATLSEGFRELEGSAYDLVFLDVRLPDGNGLEALPRVVGAPSRPEVIILTGQGDAQGAEAAIQGGVWDYLVKPTPLKDTMASVERALKYREEKNQARPESEDMDGLVAESPAMRSSLEQLQQAAGSNSPVLITGETGTGKELFARKIHDLGPRSEGRFVVVDCAALAENLVESILFGHKRGSFTGAERDTIGLVERAHGGTLFLDEIGELPLDTQRVFLRVLQEKRFRPVGDVAERASDFRLVAATNRDLQAMIDQGCFRSDLFYRLRAIHLELPPLRHRPEDIRTLTLHRLAAFSQIHRTMDDDFFACLQAYGWPGNVRELFAVVETALAAAGTGDTLYAQHLPPEVRIARAKAALGPGAAMTDMAARPAAGDIRLTNAPLAPQDMSSPPDTLAAVPQLNPDGPSTYKDFKVAMEHAYLSDLLERSGRNLEDMLLTSGLSKSHLYALLKKHGLGGK